MSISLIHNNYFAKFVPVNFLIRRNVTLGLMFAVCRKRDSIEKLRFTFTPNGKREFVPRDQVFSLIVVNCLVLQLKNK